MGSVIAVGPNGERSDSGQATVTTGASGVNIPGAAATFTHAVTASSGDVKFDWTPSTVNASHITGWIVQMREADGTLYRQWTPVAATRTLTAPMVPAGTYNASIVPTSAGGNGSSTNIGTITVPSRATQNFPPPRNPNVLSLITTTVPVASGNYQGSWDAPDGATPLAENGYMAWIANLGSYTPLLTSMRSQVALGSFGNLGRIWQDVVMRVVARYGGGNSHYVSRERRTINPGFRFQDTAPPNVRPVTAVSATPSTTTAGEATVSVTSPPVSGQEAFNAEIIVTAGTQQHVVAVAVIGPPSGNDPVTHTFTGLPQGVQLAVQARMGGRMGMSAVMNATMTLPRTVQPAIPAPSGLGTSGVTATGGSITGPSSLPTNVHEIRYYVALASSPTTPLSTHPNTIASAFPLSIANLSRNTAYVVQVQYGRTEGTVTTYGPHTAVSLALGTAGIAAPATPASISIVVSATTQGTVNMSVPLTATATHYDFVYWAASDPTLTYAPFSASGRQAEFRNVPVGSWVGGGRARNAGGSSSSRTSTFPITRLAPPPAPVSLVAPRLVRIGHGFGANIYTLTGSWSSVTGATGYNFQWYSRAAGSTLWVRMRGTGASGSTTGNIAQLASDDITLTDGSDYRLDVRATAGTSTVGPVGSTFVTAQIPTVTVPTGSQLIRVLSLAITHSGITIRFTRPTGIVRFPWRIRTSTGVTDLQSGTLIDNSGAGIVFITSLMPLTRYIAWVRAQAGVSTDRTGQLYPETSVAFETSAAPASGGVGGQASGEHYTVWVDPLDGGELEPGDGLGEDGDTATLLNDGSEWIKRAGAWHKL